MKGSVKDMNVEQIVELIQAVSASSIGELNYEEGNLKISLKKKWKHAVVRKKNIILPHLALNISSPARFARSSKFIANVYTQWLAAMKTSFGLRLLRPHSL